MNDKVNPDPENSAMTVTADIIIIGGGIAGISVAARLSEEARVIVLEREAAAGTHSTGRSAAILVQNYGNATLRALTAASVPFFEDCTLSGTPLLSPRGDLAVTGEQNLPEFEKFIANATGLEVLTPAEAAGLFPLLREERIAGAALEADARDIDVDALLQGFLKQLRSQNGKVHCNSAISSIVRNGVWCVKTAADTYEAPVLVNAAGAWADEIAALAGMKLVGLTPMRRSAAVLPAPQGEDISRWPMVGAFDESWYCKPQSGKLLVSPSEEDPLPPQDVCPDDMVLAAGLDRFERATHYKLSRVERSWAGLRSFVADRTPVAGFAPDADGFFWLAGQGGYGIQTSPALSRLAADLVLGRKPDIADEKTVAALSAGRSGIGAEDTLG